MKKIIFFLIFTIFLNNISFAQANKIDSLQTIYKVIDLKLSTDKAMEILDELYQLTYLSKPQLSTEYIARAIFICDSIKKDKESSIKWKQRLANIYFEQNLFDQAMFNYVEIKNYYQSIKDDVNYAYSLFYLANVYHALQVPEIAISEYKKANDIFIKKEEKEGIVLSNIKIAILQNENYETELSYSTLIKTLNIITEKDNYLRGLIYENLGNLYAIDFETDSSLYYLEKAINEFEVADNKLFIAKCYLELSKIFIEEEELENAFSYLTNSFELYDSLNVPSKTSECYNLFGQINYLKENFNEAILYFEKSLEIATNNQLIHQKYSSYQFLSKIYQSKGDLKKANEYLTLYIEEINNSQTEQRYAEVILTFQNEEKQKEIEWLEKEDNIKQKLIYASIFVIALLFAFAILFYYYMQKQKKVNKLLQEQNRQINLQKKEIESQSKILEKATRNLIKQKDEIENKNKKITSSIAYASRIQKAMLPSDNVFKNSFVDYFILYKPKETVSGDFYWISELRDQKPSLFKANANIVEKIVISVIDCTGHGVPGAFMAMLGDAFMNQIVNVQHIIEPDKILSELHKIIRITLQQEQSENNDGMDMALCVIDKKNKTMEFCGAKNPIVYIQNDKVYRIHGDLMSIGGLQREHVRLFVKHTIDITAKTYVYLYSDGFQDQFGGKYGRKLMAQPFRDLLFKNHKEPFEFQKKELIRELKEWKGRSYNQMDDITVIGFQV